MAVCFANGTVLDATFTYVFPFPFTRKQEESRGWLLWLRKVHVPIFVVHNGRRFLLLDG